MLGEVLGVERRRRWSEDEKLEILSEVGVGGASVTQVAQRHEITRSQIYGWRRDLKKKGLWSPDCGAVFLPVDFSAAQAPASASAPSRPVPVELRLADAYAGFGQLYERRVDERQRPHTDDRPHNCCRARWPPNKYTPSLEPGRSRVVGIRRPLSAVKVSMARRHGEAKRKNVGAPAPGDPVWVLESRRALKSDASCRRRVDHLCRAALRRGVLPFVSATLRWASLVSRAWEHDKIASIRDFAAIEPAQRCCERRPGQVRRDAPGSARRTATDRMQVRHCHEWQILHRRPDGPPTPADLSAAPRQ